MISFAAIGNDLYTGKRSIDFVGHRKKWYILSGILLSLAFLGLFVNGLNLGLEFRGGSEFRVAESPMTQNYEFRAQGAVQSVVPDRKVGVTQLGSGTVRVQTERLDDHQSADVRQRLADEFEVSLQQVSASFVGPSWGQSVTKKAIQALIWFLILVSVAMSLYFRTWKMSLSALVALAHDLIATVGIYALVGFEVSPASMLGFLTILGYSLYDTVIVFDKVRENTDEAFTTGRQTFGEACNLAVNQTLVRSINTTVVALIPIAAILVVGFGWLGPGTLLDLSLALFVGVAVGAYSSIVIATPLFVTLRNRDDDVKELNKRAEKFHSKQQQRQVELATAAAVRENAPLGETPAGSDGGPVPISDDTDRAAGLDDDEPTTVTGRKIHRYAAQSGPRNQPRRKPKSQR